MKDCFCVLDEDAECVACRQRIYEAVTKFAEIQIIMQKEMKQHVDQMKNRCKGCDTKYLDGAVGGMIRKFAAETDLPRAGIAFLVKQFTTVMMIQGVATFPQTLKAWEDVCALKGWDVGFE